MVGNEWLAAAGEARMGCVCRAVVGVVVVIAVSVGAPPRLDAQSGVPVAPGSPVPPREPPARAQRPDDAAPKGTAMIRGIVVAADSGTPLRRARVRAFANDSRDVRDVRAATTDDDGRFTLTELVGGRYT